MKNRYDIVKKYKDFVIQCDFVNDLFRTSDKLKSTYNKFSKDSEDLYISMISTSNDSKHEKGSTNTKTLLDFLGLN
jgi:hypothetical protein